MKRNPSIHITKLQFEKILSYLEIDNFPVEAFFVVASKEAINTRTVTVTNKKDNKKITNTLLATKGDAALAADILYSIRVKLRHRGVRKIQESNTREWDNCKKLASICNDFCEEFNLETRAGFIKYMEIGIERMSNSYRGLTLRLISMSESIFTQYASAQELGNLTQEDKDKIKLLHDYYVKKIADKTGIYEPMDNNPEMMAHFKNLHDMLLERGWADDYKDYLEAQFEALVWCNGLPEVSTLYSEKAIGRYTKYLFKLNKPTDKPKVEVEGSLWDKIK